MPRRYRTCWFISSSLLITLLIICTSSLLTEGMSIPKSTTGLLGWPLMFIRQFTLIVLLAKLLPMFRSDSDTPLTVCTA